MLQMAANAAAPAASSRRTAETNTSTLWAPSAPLLQGQTSSPALPSTALDTQLEQQHWGEASGTAAAEELSQQEVNRAQDSSCQAAMELVQAPAAADGAVASEGCQDSPEAEAPSITQQAQHAQHHDASQPWARAQTQPALPVVSVSADRPRLSVRPEQRRRATAADAPVPAAVQQHRQGSGLNAARSLSWSHSAAEDQPLNSQRSSGRPCISLCCKPGGQNCGISCSTRIGGLSTSATCMLPSPQGL